MNSRVCLVIAGLGLSLLIGSPSFAGEAIYDRDGNLKYRIDGNKVYDRNWGLKYRRDGDRIYDRDWNLKGRIRRR